MKNMKQKAMAAVIGLALVGAGIAGGFVMDTPNTIVQKEIVEVEVPVIEYVEVAGETVTETIINTVYVDNGDLDLVLQYLEDKDVFDDAQEIVADIKKEDVALGLAIAELKDEFADELEDAGIVDDEDDVDLIKVYDDLDEYELVDSDYDDDEFKFLIKAKVEDEDVDEKFKVFFEIEVEDGEAKITDVYREE